MMSKPRAPHKDPTWAEDAVARPLRFAEALQLHKAGRLAEAEARYRQILAAAPDDPETLHLLGVLACQTGHVEAASGLIERAIAQRGDVAAYYYNLGLARQLQAQAPAAIAAFQRAVALLPSYVDAWNNLAVLLLLTGRLEEAEAGFLRALALQPDHVEANCNLGIALHRLGRGEAAIARFDQALRLRPDYPEALRNRAAALIALGRLAEAAAELEHALALRPADLDALLELGALSQQQGRLDAAAAWFERAAVVAPNRAEAWNGLACMRHGQGRLDEAAALFEKSIALKPLQPEIASNLAMVLKDRGEIPAAIRQLDRALELAPDFAAARLNRAMLQLMAGDFAAGWREYEARWQTPLLDPDRRQFPVARWDGGVGTGGTLLLWAEQGLGDTLQFCRYAPLAAERGWRVVLETPQPLVGLLSSLDGVEVAPIGASDLAQIERHCPLMSLPLLFRTTLETIPGTSPYLAAPQDAVARWRRRLGLEPGRLAVGLVWAGNPGRLTSLHAAIDRKRSIPLQHLAPLFAVPGTRFVSLQKDRRPGDDPAAYGLLDPMDEVRSFADTAAIVAGLDLVITVDTSVVHLAGALGQRVWLLNRRETCWRWLLDRDDSPWYPSLRQFRQTASGDWQSVIGKLGTALAALAAGQGA
jgi:tetratricopeptide (TPR) repeat protein